MDGLLGRLSDTEIAERFHISRTSVYNRRRKLNLPRHPQKRRVPPPPMGGWNKRIWKEAELKILGTVPDHKLATLLGISKTTVMNKRRSLGIPSYESQTRIIKWNPKMDNLLGTDYDRAIAEQLNLSLAAISQRRYHLGIPAYQKRLIPSGMDSHSKEALNFYNRRRRSMLKQLPSTMTLDDWHFALDYFDHKCAYCEADESLSQDHLSPVANGGGYVTGNIVPACGSCNSSKSTFDWQDWIKAKFEKEADRIIQRILDYKKTAG